MYDELHARPAVEIPTPALVTHVAFVTGAPNRSPDSVRGTILRARRIIALIRTCYRYFEAALPGDDWDAPDDADDEAQLRALRGMLSRFKHQQILAHGDRLCVLQDHTEFLSLTFIAQTQALAADAWSAIPPLGEDIRADEVRPDIATHLRIERLAADRPDADGLMAAFNGLTPAPGTDDAFRVEDVYRDLIASRVSDGAYVWTPFRPFADGFNRILVRNVDLSPARTGRLVQRLLEIDTYVYMALLGLDPAREQLQVLRRHQGALAAALAEPMDSKEDQRRVYQRLSALSQATAKDIASTRYRFYASRAYADLVWERVEQLREARVPGWPRLGYFLDRTFRPAARTCEAALNFQTAISQSIEQAAQLLGAGVSIDLEYEGKAIERRMLYLTIVILALTLMAALYYTSHVLSDWGLIALPGAKG